MSFSSNKRVIFLGYNNLFKHKRGVENVIEFQSYSSLSEINYYIHWDDKNTVYHYGNLICIAVKKNFFWILGLNLILTKIKRKNTGSFIHSHNPLMSIVSIYQSGLFTVHDGLYYLSKARNHSLKKVFYILEKLLYLRVKYVHFISKYSKSESLFSQVNNKFVIIPNTSHLENHLIGLSNSDDSCKLKLFGSETFKILVVRSIEDRARIDLVIDVALNLQNENIEIIVAGKGPLLEKYRNIVKQSNLTNIKLLGYVDDENLICLYKECELVLMPAEYGEGFGLPMIEGYLFNKPVLASNKCAIPEFIFSDNYLFENNSKSIIEKIKFVKKTEKVDFVTYYKNRFSNKKVIEEMTRLYNLLQL